MSHPLDNPIWSALSSQHAPLARVAGPIRRYPREIAPFLGIPEGLAPSADDLDALVDPGESVFLLGDAPAMPAGWRLESLGLLLQMEATDPPVVPPGLDIVPLVTNAQRRDVRVLTSLVYPHYFRSETMQLGRYFGLYEHGTLAGMVGERMGCPGFREVSAVCTHPEWTGRGFARRLFAWLTGDLLASGQVPFLHVSPQNRRAIDLYLQNGYRVRHQIPFHQLDRA